MKKHECYIDTGRSRGDILRFERTYGYIAHDIRINDKAGFITRISAYGEPLKLKTLGSFFMCHDDQQKFCYEWSLVRNDVEIGYVMSKKYYSQQEAIASLKRALNRRGYRLLTRDEATALSIRDIHKMVATLHAMFFPPGDVEKTTRPNKTNNNIIPFPRNRLQ